MAISKEFLAACQRRYRNIAALILQDVIRQKMEPVHGENFIDALRCDIAKMAKSDEETVFQRYSTFYKKYGDNFPITKMDVSVCCSYITDYKLAEDKKEKDCINDLRELRNDEGHEVNPLEDTSEEDMVFYRKATRTLEDAAKAFDLPEKLRERITAYSLGKWSLSEEPKSEEELLREANRLLLEKEYEEGFSKIMHLVELFYGPAMLRASQLYRTESMPIEKYRLGMAFSLAERAISTGVSGAEYATRKLSDIISLCNKNTEEAYLERAALHKAGEYLPKKWHYIKECYDAAEKCGWQGKNEQLKKDLFEGEFPEVTDTVCKEEKYDILLEYLDFSGEEKALAFLESQDHKENAFLLFLHGLYLKEGKGCEKNPELAEEYYKKTVLLCEKENSFPDYYIKACYSLANYDGKDAESILAAFEYDKKAMEKCNDEKSRLRYELKKSEYIDLGIWDEAYKFEVLKGLLGKEGFKDFQTELWKNIESFLGGIKDALMQIFREKEESPEERERRRGALRQYKEFLEKQEFFSDKNPLFDFFEDSYTSYKKALAHCRDVYVVYRRKLDYEDYIKNYDYDFWTNREEVLKEARKGRFEELIGPQSESFWGDSDKVYELVDAYERKEEYEKLIGSHSLDFWKDEKKVEKEVEAAKLKKLYSNIIKGVSEDFWYNKDRVEKEAAAHNRKVVFTGLIYPGYIDEEIWYDDERVQKALAATKLKEKYQNILKASDDIWFNEEAVMREVNAITLKEKYGERLKDSPSHIWYDEVQVQKELKALEIKEKYENELPGVNPEIWYDEREVIRKLDILSLKKKYKDKLPLEDEKYWKDEKTVLSAIEGLKRKSRYEKEIGEHDMAFWMNEKLVNEATRKYYRQQKYLSKLGEPDAGFWTLEGYFDSYYFCAKKLKEMLMAKNYKEKLTWDFLFNYVYEVTEGHKNRDTYHFYTRDSYFRPVEKALGRKIKEGIDSQVQSHYRVHRWKADASYRRWRERKNITREIKDNLKVIIVFLIVSAVLGCVVNGILSRFIESTVVSGILSAIAGIFCCVGLCKKKL